MSENNNQRATWWKRVLGMPFCAFGLHRLHYRYRGRTRENWSTCVYCGKDPAWKTK